MNTSPVKESLPELPKAVEGFVKCEDCEGTGHVGELIYQGEFQPPEMETCASCGGSGRWDVQCFTLDQMREYGRQCALQAIAAPREGWVSVADRLPAKWTEVLIWPRPSDYCHVGELVMNDGWEWHEYETGFGDVVRHTQVTHWMPLPEPPAAPLAVEATEK